MILLVTKKFRIPSIGRKQFLLRSTLNDPSILQYNNLLCQSDIGQTMGGKETGLALGHPSQHPCHPLWKLDLSIHKGLITRNSVLKNFFRTPPIMLTLSMNHSLSIILYILS